MIMTIKIEAATRLSANSVIALQNQLKALKRAKPAGGAMADMAWRKKIEQLKDQIKEAKKGS